MKLVTLTLVLTVVPLTAFARGSGTWPKGTGDVVFFLIWLLVCAYNGLMLSAARKAGEYWVHSVGIAVMLGIASIFADAEHVLVFAGAAGLGWIAGRMFPGKR